MALVEVRGLSKSYPRRHGFAGLRKQEHLVVDAVSFSIHQGETMGLVGESGSGKSTVARMVLGLIAPTAGSITFDGRTVNGARQSEMNRLRRRMQPVFQDPYAALNPRMRVREIITEPLVIHRSDGHRSDGHRSDGLRRGGHQHDGHGGNADWKTSRAALDEKSRDLLRAVGLDESALHRYPHEFSGGQRQRINIARALALRPEFLVLDEPVSALDVSVGAQIVNLLRGLQRDFGLTYLFISHSMPLVRYLSTNIAVMQRGKLVEIGPRDQVCLQPRDPYTCALLSATPELEPA